MGLFAGQMMAVSIGLGALLSLGFSIRAVLKARKDGGGWAEMKTPLYYAQTFIAFGLVGAGVAKAMLPPQHLSIVGKVNPAVTAAADIDRGFHCLVDVDGALQHPGIAALLPAFKKRFISRERLEITGHGIARLARTGVTKGFHIYSINYDHLHYKSGEKIPTPRRSSRTYWVDHTTCDAELRGDSTYGVFDPLSFINLNDWFGR